ncbi:MAG: hypothetical protein ABI717_04375 [Actinomycetota bacterium]
MKTLAFLAAAVLAGTLVLVGAVMLAPDAGTAAPKTQRLLIDVYGTGHGTAVPSNFAVRPRVPVEITIVNHTAQLHTFTIDELGANAAVMPAIMGPTSITVRFTPKHGVLHWHCVPCRSHMHGMILALLELRAGSV